MAIETFLELYLPIVFTLDTLRINGDTKAEQLYHAVNSFEHIVCTCISCFLLSEITPLSRLLQTPTLDFATAQRHVVQLDATLQEREADPHSFFKNIVYEQACEIAKELFVNPVLPRAHQRRLAKSMIETEDFYGEKVFIPFLHELRFSINKRLTVFAQPRLQLLTQLRPERIAIISSVAELYKELKEKFGTRLPQPMQLYGELERWKKESVVLLDKSGYANKWLSEMIHDCDPTIYPNVHHLFIYLATLLVTTASAERSFSALKRIKTYCRSTMTENRLNGLAAAFIHKKVDIEPEEILSKFVLRHPRRLDFGS